MGERKALLKKHSSNKKKVNEENKDDLYFGKYVHAENDSDEMSINTLNESYVQRAYRRE